MINFDYNKLNNLRIHELRDLARKVGVKSPTSLKKDVIIEQILLILSGENKPYVNLTKQGRPAKTLDQIDELVDFFVPKNINANVDTQKVGSYNLNNENRYEFFANASSVSFNENINITAEKASGYLFVHKNGYGIIRINGFAPSDNDIFLHAYAIKTYNLHTGDFLEGEVKLVHDDRPKVMVNIVAVNKNVNFEKQPRVSFEKLPYFALTQPLNFHNATDFQGVKLMEGSRNLFLSNQADNFESVINFARSLSKEYKVFVINLDAKPEEGSDFDQNIIFQNINFNETDSFKSDVAKLMVEVAKREAENDKKVVVIMNRITTLVKAINNIECGEFGKALQINTAHKIKNLIMCAKNINKNANLTLVVFNGNKFESYLKEFVEFEFSNLFNNVINI